MREVNFLLEAIRHIAFSSLSFSFPRSRCSIIFSPLVEVQTVSDAAVIAFAYAFY